MYTHAYLTQTVSIQNHEFHPKIRNSFSATLQYKYCERETTLQTIYFKIFANLRDQKFT